MRKYIICIFLTSILCQQISNAEEVSQNTDQRMAQTYQKGLEAAKKAEQDQTLYEKNQGNPKMAEASQEGLQAAQEKAID